MQKFLGNTSPAWDGPSYLENILLSRAHFALGGKIKMHFIPCITQAAPTWDVSLLVATAIEILVQGKLLRCPNGKYFKFLGPRLPLYLLCLHLLIVLVQQDPLGLTNSNRFECIHEVLCGERKIMLLGF